MFYIIRRNYVGPNWADQKFIDFDTIEILTAPATTNQSHEICLEGWCGTTNDIEVVAYGEYATLEAARNAITSIFGKVRKIAVGDDGPNGDRSILETYKPGEFRRESLEATQAWGYEIIEEMISSDTSDAEIDSRVERLERESNDEGYTRKANLQYLMSERREELRVEGSYDE